MLKNKKGLIGKIFAIIGIIFLIILLIGGITAWQGYSFYKTAMAETDNIKAYSEKLMSGDCTQIKNIESSASNIKTKAKNACANPIIKISLEKMQEVPIKCSNLKELENQMQQELAKVKSLCSPQNSKTTSQTINNSKG